MRYTVRTGCISVIALFFLCFYCIAQKPVKFEHLGSEDGLSQSSVNCILQDRYGLMWFGTQDGLNLFDGTTFRVFQNQPGDSTSLSSNYIVSMCEDIDSNLWIGTLEGGLNYFDRKSEHFKVFRNNPEAPGSISNNTAWSVLVDSEGILWVATSNGLNRYDRHTSHFTVYLHQENNEKSLPANMVTSLKEDSDKRVWIGTTMGTACYDRSSDRIIPLMSQPGTIAEGANTTWSFTEIARDVMLMGTDNGAYILDRENQITPVFNVPQGHRIIVWSVLSDRKGGAWLGTDQGLMYYYPGDKLLSVYVHKPTDTYSLPDNTVWCLHIDETHNLWTGTNNGIGKTNIAPPKFNSLVRQEGCPFSLSNNHVNCILEDKTGGLWIGTQGGGLNHLVPGTNRIEIFNTANSGLSNDNIWSIIEDHNGDLWIGAYPGGLNFYNTTSGRFNVFRSYPGGLSNERVLTLLEDQNGVIWIGTRGGGLDRYDKSTGHFTTFVHDESDSFSISGNTVLTLAQDKFSYIWIGTYEAGLNRYDPGKNVFTTYRNSPGVPGTISNNTVLAVLPDSKGRLWIGTQGGLNLVMDPTRDMTFINFTTNDGLPGNTIICLAEDNHGNIWMSTFRGIVKLNLDFLEAGLKKHTDEQGIQESHFEPLFHVYDMNDGLPSIEFNQGSYHKGESGTIYFGSADGLTYFSPDSVTSSSFIAPVIITGFKIFNRNVNIAPVTPMQNHRKGRLTVKDGSYSLSSPVAYLDNITLTYRESVITFEFSALDYTSPNKNLYAYMMENFDKGWNFVGHQNSATYTNLDPGEYIFMIRGTNADGIWNMKGRSLQLIILPPYWQTTWFIALCALTGLALLTVTVMNLIRRQRRKALRDKEFAELQLKTIKNQIDPHFAFNAMNAIASFIYSEKPDVVYNYFSRFARLIRMTLEDSERISRRLDEELDFVRNYLELQSVRYKDRFTFIFQIDESITSDTLIPKMILQTYVENAIQHGLAHKTGKGTLQIKVFRQDDDVKITIEDDGIGRQKAAELGLSSTRRGFQIIKTIIELYSQLYHTPIEQNIKDLYDDSGSPAGTRVTITLKQQNEHRK